MLALAALIAPTMALQVTPVYSVTPHNLHDLAGAADMRLIRRCPNRAGGSLPGWHFPGFHEAAAL